MDTIDRINNIIQPFLDEKGNYDYLKPINLVERQFKVDRKFGFYPTGGSKEEYDAPPEFKDESERLEFIKILNTDIRAYNKWAGDRPQYPNIDEFPEYSFLVVRDGDPYVDKRLYIEIHDELLYEHIQDEDFVPRFNRTIYEYLISKKESAQAEDRWDEKNIWYTPYRNFGDWFDRHPQYGDVKSYFEGIADCDIGVSIDGEHRSAVQMVKKLSRQNKALKIHRHKPNPMEMKEIIDKNRFKNDKCNNTKVGSDLGVDPETAKRWIEKLGLSDYAYNPHHLK